MKFAIVADGGKQYKVQEGEVISLEKVSKKEGADYTFKSVLMYADGKQTKVGTPAVKGVSVKGKVVEQGRSNKVPVMKYKSKIRYRRNKGHRQPYTKIKIDSIRASA